ncbi:MAG: DUF3180 domain-containing protein [Propionibacteriaceae bacterium]
MPEQPVGTIRPTPLRVLLVAALAGAVVGWLVVVVSTSLAATPPQPPWSAPIALLVAAAGVGVLAYATHQQLQVQRRRIDPQRAVSSLVLGKASALGGALVVGGYLAFALMFVGRIDAEIPRERVIRSAVAVVAGIGLGVAGLLLERACRVPGSDEDGEDEVDKRV